MSAERARSWQQGSPAQRPQQQPKRQVKVKVQKKTWITPGEKVLYAFFGFIILAAAAYFVTFAASTYNVNSDLEALESKIDRQQVANKDLTYEVKELSKPERIIDIARDAGLKVQSTKVKEANKVSE
ncbi:cell division protein FtsL [Terribacillus aidingensis]|uniref:Cell division protein FtsL n=1 Tax=Terribacillus aidingensis TaxID=586416 RepID=A0A285NNY6_9BACI|nr:cell division protein FtsL [Terribacillus aidingensis]SNZ09351.1 cell division protein FtsL [Terribacillus aidingensis]